MGFVRLHEENTRIEEIPFMSETKWMAVKTKRTFAFGNEEVNGKPLINCANRVKGNVESSGMIDFIESLKVG